jgi:hypothetical protein
MSPAPAGSTPKTGCDPRPARGFPAIQSLAPATSSKTGAFSWEIPASLGTSRLSSANGSSGQGLAFISSFRLSVIMPGHAGFILRSPSPSSSLGWPISSNTSPTEPFLGGSGIGRLPGGLVLFALLVVRDYVKRGRPALAPWRFFAAGFILLLAIYCIAKS